MESKKKWHNPTYLQNRKRCTHLENKLTVTGWEEGGEGTVREFGMDVYTLLYLKLRTSKDLLEHRERCSTFSGGLAGRGVWGEGVHGCVHAMCG